MIQSLIDLFSIFVDDIDFIYALKQENFKVINHAFNCFKARMSKDNDNFWGTEANQILKLLFKFICNVCKETSEDILVNSYFLFA